jgi:deoxyadenosine/deoxycytidine kinase
MHANKISIDTNIIAKKKHIICEIVGVAGAGKTTISHLLNQRNVDIQTVFQFKRIKKIPILLHISPLLIKDFFYRFRKGRMFTWREIKEILHIKMILDYLERQSLDHPKVSLLDHGPLFVLTCLHLFFLKRITTKSLTKLWDDIFNQLSSILDVVIWLDAPDNVLKERIDSRSGWHIVQEKQNQDAYEFLAGFRTSYKYVISHLTASNKDLRVLCFNTHEESLNQVVEKIIDLIDL